LTVDQNVDFNYLCTSDKIITMPSIRELKDEINTLAHDLINECFMYRHFHPAKDGEVNKVISDVIRMRTDLIFRINHPEGKDDPKILRVYYKKIREDMGKMGHLTDKLKS